jgi:hypothetical protein
MISTLGISGVDEIHLIILKAHFLLKVPILMSKLTIWFPSLTPPPRRRTEHLVRAEAETRRRGKCLQFEWIPSIQLKQLSFSRSKTRCQHACSKHEHEILDWQIDVWHDREELLLQYEIHAVDYRPGDIRLSQARFRLWQIEFPSNCGRNSAWGISTVSLTCLEASCLSFGSPIGSWVFHQLDVGLPK